MAGHEESSRAPLRLQAAAWAAALLAAACAARGDYYTWQQEQKLTNPAAAEGDKFGYAVSLCDDYLLVGAEGDQVAGAKSGSATVYSHDGIGWVEQVKLTPDDGEDYDYFGTSVSICGDWAVIGALGEDEGGAMAGAAYVFRRSGTDWTQQAKLTASDAHYDDMFGASVSICGDTLVVGACYDRDGAIQSGSAYVYHWDGADWNEQAKLLPGDGGNGDCFGISVGIDGDYIVAGAFGHGASDMGAAYVFCRDGNDWDQQAKLTASDATAWDDLGYSVSISGDTIVAGAKGDDHGGSVAGSAYVFERDGNDWAEQAKLIADDADAGYNFGEAVAIRGDRIVAGCHLEHSGFFRAGAAYVFQLDGNDWAQQARLTALDPAADDYFGTAVATDGNQVVVGAYGNDDDGSQSGSAYVFGGTLIVETTWQRPAGDPGSWHDAGNWSSGVSTATADTAIENGGTALIDSGTARAYFLRIGSTGAGAVVQTGGTLEVGGHVFLGTGAGAEGTYELGGSGTLGVAGGSLVMGRHGTATFTQTGGTAEIGDSLVFGCPSAEGAGGASTCTLTGGELRVPQIQMYNGSAELMVDGGQLVNPSPPDPCWPEVAFQFYGDAGDFTFGGSTGVLRLGVTWAEITRDNTFTQTGGTVVAEHLSIDGSWGGQEPCSPSYELTGGELRVGSGGDLDALSMVGGGTFDQTGGTVEVAGDLVIHEGTCRIAAGEVEVRRSQDEWGNWLGGAIRLSVDGEEANAVLAVEGGTVRADFLLAGEALTKDSSGRECTVSLAGGRVLLNYGGAIRGVIEGHGEVVSGGPIDVGGTILAPAGGMLTLDFDANGPIATGETLEIPPDAGLRMRVPIADAVHNAGRLASYGGDLRLTGDVVNTGTLANNPFTTLFVHAASLDHTGSVEAHQGGGVNFKEAVTNHPGQTIALYGGGVSAPQITNAPGGEITGTGMITADLVNQGTADFFGMVQVFGQVVNEAGATLGVRNGSLLVTGPTTNEGTIKVTNGQAYFEGGLDGNGLLDIDPALASVVGDLHVGPSGVITADGGSTLLLMGDFANESTRNEAFDLSAAAVRLHGQGEQLLEAAGQDLGACLDGWAENFAIGTLVIEPGTIASLVDASDNRPGGEGEAVYVGDLVIEPGGGVCLDGTNLYYLNGGAPKQLFRGDCDLDGDVDWQDYAALAGSFGEFAGEAAWCHGDTDGDGDVDWRDYVALKRSFGSETVVIPPAVPEPAALALLAAGAAALLGRKRR